MSGPAAEVSNGAMMNLGRVLRQWRWAEKLELKDAAAIFGTTPSTLSRLERGQAVVGGDTLAKIIVWLLSPAPPAPE